MNREFSGEPSREERMGGAWILPRRLRISRPHTFLVLLFALLTVTFYLAVNEQDDDDFQYFVWRPYDESDEAPDQIKYLVWNSKCHMLSMNPNDSSIRRFVKKEEFEACSTKPRLSSISKSNESVHLFIDRNVAAEYYGNVSCCLAEVTRGGPPAAKSSNVANLDSLISVGECQHFQDRVLLDKSIQVVRVICHREDAGDAAQEVYQNVHPVINPRRARDRLGSSGFQQTFGGAAAAAANESATKTRPLSVLMLGLDSVSRLNFYRTMPVTRAYFEERGWIELRGYNKIGDNTFPNLMAILTGRGEAGSGSASSPECDAQVPLDRCPMIWYKFRDSGYATAYAEDTAVINTFTNAKAGFVEPPTDYYLRPYVLASEQLLPTRQRFGWTYCAGPELAADRTFDAAVDFARAFAREASFGFFWTNSLSHEYLNGPSMYDRRFADKLLQLESGAVMESSMVVVLSDHGMRFGDSRDTFIGWYEERLPLIYIWLPRWFRQQEPRAYDALLVNRDRLTSPYDLYETLGDIVRRAGRGRAPAPDAAASSGCPRCSSLFTPVPRERGCRDAGISPHWCTCAAFEPYDATDPIAIQGAIKFVEYVNSVTENYTTNLGIRLCSRLKLKQIVRVKRMLDFDADPDPVGQAFKLFYSLELTPGGGKFETTVTYHGLGRYTLREEEVSRINLYGHDARCLDKGHKKYCQCRFNVAYSILKWF